MADKTVKINVTNNAPGPRFVNTTSGPQVLASGETAEGLEFLPAEVGNLKKHLIDGTDVATFTIGGDAEKPADPFANASIADLRKVAEAESIDLGDASKRDDIIAKIVEARKAKEGGGQQ